MAEALGKRPEDLLMDWQRGYTSPVVAAVQRGRLDEARHLHNRASRALDQAPIGEDQREAIGFMLELLDYNIRFMESEGSWTRDNYRAALFHLSRPAHTEAGRQARLSGIIKLRSVADRDGFDELTRDQIEILLSEVDGPISNPAIWHDLAGWAFEHRDLPILERAFAAHSVNPSPLMGYAKWQRINLMYQLLSGKATRRDVVETIKTLEILPQLHEFMLWLWPASKEAGLVDEEIEGMLAELIEKIEDERPAGKMESPTRKLRTHRY